MVNLLYDLEDKKKPEYDKWEHMLFEITDYCNLDCPFCLNASSRNNTNFMSIEDFKTMVDKIKDHVLLENLWRIPFSYRW